MTAPVLASPRCAACRARIWYADGGWTDSSGAGACPAGPGHDPGAPARQAAAAAPRPLLVERPRCPSGHGHLTLRNPAGGWTPEQEFCGVWYDCRAASPVRCFTSVLLPSVAYLEWLARAARP